MSMSPLHPVASDEVQSPGQVSRPVSFGGAGPAGRSIRRPGGVELPDIPLATILTQCPLVR